MANPFFSGRIPQDLLDRVEQHVRETGQSKTDILINALAAYLNHPVIRPALVSSPGEERFRALEERLTLLEEFFREKGYQIAVISNDNNNLDHTMAELTISKTVKDTFRYQSDNNPTNGITLPNELVEDPWLKNTDNNSDNRSRTTFPILEEPMKLLVEHVPKKFENLTSSELASKTGIKSSQLDRYKKQVATEFVKSGRLLENKKLLDAHEKIETQKPVTIHSYPYDLFYLGQNEKGNNLWSVIPYDNNRYQKLMIDTSDLFLS